MHKDDAVAMTAGGWVVLRDDGKVVSFRNPNSWSDPVTIKGLSDVIAIAGANPGWALERDGVVLKWEYHCSNQEMPICDIGPAHPIIGVKNATAISRYGDYGLVLERDGSVWGLGEDRDGQITGSAGGSRNQKPTKRMLSRPLMQIAAGWKITRLRLMTKAKCGVGAAQLTRRLSAKVRPSRRLMAPSPSRLQIFLSHQGLPRESDLLTGSRWTPVAMGNKYDCVEGRENHDWGIKAVSHIGPKRRRGG